MWYERLSSEGVVTISMGRLLRHLSADDLAHDRRRVGHAVVLVGGVEDLPGHPLFGCFQQQRVQVDHVVDVQVGPHLRAAENRDLAGVHGMVREDVDRQVQPLPGRMAADRRRAAR